MLHPSSACPYAQPSLDLIQNKTEANWKSRSLWRRLFAKPIYLMQRNLNPNHSECVRECVLRVVWALQLEEPRHVLLAQAQFDVSSRAISQIDRNVTTDTPQSVRMCVCAYDRVCVSYHQLCLGPHFRHVFYNVANLSFDVARQHVAATFSFRLNWMHLESRSAAEASSLYDHHHHHPRTIGCH